MLVTKEIIRPGTYFYKDTETGLPRKLTVNPEGVKHLYDTGKAMLASGLSVPVPLEHQPTAKALTPAEKMAQQLRDNAGWVKDYELKDGILFGNLDIQDPEIAKKLPNTIRWTSPWINSFTDGNGKEWNGVISHLALTTRPRITQQQPFPSVAAAMSLAGTLAKEPFDASKVSKGIALSRAGLLDVEGDKIKPHYPVAFSLWAGAALAEEEMPKEEKKEKPTEKIEGKPPAKKVEGKPEGEPKPEGEAKVEGKLPEEAMEGAQESLEQTLIDAEGDMSVYAVLCDLLESEGYAVPEGTTKDNFAERMYQILMDKLKGKAMAEEPVVPDPAATNQPGNNGTPNKPPVVQEQPPLYMSLESIEQIQDPNVRQALKVSLSLQNNLLEGAKERRMHRIERIVKKVRQTGFQDKVLAIAGSCQLSMTPEGKVVDSMSPFLDALESGIRDLPALMTSQQSQLSIQAHPEEYSGDMSEKRREELIDMLAKGIK